MEYSEFERGVKTYIPGTAFRSVASRDFVMACLTELKHCIEKGGEKALDAWKVIAPILFNALTFNPAKRAVIVNGEEFVLSEEAYNVLDRQLWNFEEAAKSIKGTPTRDVSDIINEKFDVGVYMYKDEYLMTVKPKPNRWAGCHSNSLDKQDYDKLSEVFHE